MAKTESTLKPSAYSMVPFRTAFQSQSFCSTEVTGFGQRISRLSEEDICISGLSQQVTM